MPVTTNDRQRESLRVLAVVFDFLDRDTKGLTAHQCVTHLINTIVQAEKNTADTESTNTDLMLDINDLITQAIKEHLVHYYVGYYYSKDLC